MEQKTAGIPIIIGVTGHRDLRKRDIPGLKRMVTAELAKIKNKYFSSEIILLDSVASGADSLCAEAALELGIKLICPLPLPANEYRKDFGEEDGKKLEFLLSKAAEVFTVPAAEPAPEIMTRDFAYRQAGIYIAEHCHVLLALWDCSPGVQDGCGTAETVGFMLGGSYEGGNTRFRAGNDGAVIHIKTPRGNDPPELQEEVRLMENEEGSLRELLRMTDTFNADAAKSRTESSDTLIPEDELSKCGGMLNSLHMLYRKADGLSMRFQKKYLTAIKSFSIFGMLLVLAFQLYDELESNMFLICYGLLIFIYILSFFIVRKRMYHVKYLQYRVLSETMRTQFYLTASGVDTNIGDAFSWTQKQDSTWVKKALAALLTGKYPETSISCETVKANWIDGQLAYHKGARRRDFRKHCFNERTAGIMLFFSVALFIVVLVLEFFFEPVVITEILKKPFPDFFLQHEGQIYTIRNLLKIILGGVSAATVFLSNYYGKLSFERKSIDHEKMAALYASSKNKYEDELMPANQLFMSLAREEIIENGNWFSYCRENPPSFNL